VSAGPDIPQRPAPRKGHSFHAWSDALASAQPVPGGGAAAALGGSLAASLVAMCARLTRDHEEYRDLTDTFGRMVVEADAVREDLMLLAEEDIMAYGAVSRARRLPHGSEDEGILRLINLNAALLGAAEVQVAVLRLLQVAASLARGAVEYGNRTTRADAAGASSLAAGAARSAWLNVRNDLALVRLEGTDTEDRDASRRAAVEREAAGLLAEVEADDRVVRGVMQLP